VEEPKTLRVNLGNAMWSFEMNQSEHFNPCTPPHVCNFALGQLLFCVTANKAFDLIARQPATDQQESTAISILTDILDMPLNAANLLIRLNDWLKHNSYVLGGDTSDTRRDGNLISFFAFDFDLGTIQPICNAIIEPLR